MTSRVPLTDDGDIDKSAFTRFAKAKATFARVQTQEQQLADIKDKRSANKQAITELAAQKTKAGDKVYVFSGGAKGLFIKLPYKDVHGLVTKDQRALKEEAAQVRKGLDADRQTLRDDGFII